jgi:hypothetical protein
MKIWAVLSSFLIMYFSYGLYLSQVNTLIIPQSLSRETPLGLYDYRGVLNVHSNFSLGTSTINEIATAANAAGLDFLLLTDLNFFNGRPKQDLYYNQTLFLAGEKLSYLDSRLLHYSVDKTPLGSTLGETQTKLADLLSQARGTNLNDLLILAHPLMAGFRWTGELPSGLDGIEVWNAKKIAQDAWAASKLSTLWSLLIYPFNAKLSFLRLFSEPYDELSAWDQGTKAGAIWGFSGAEASARAFPFTDYLLKFPSYQRSFEFVTQHILLKSELTGKTSGDSLKIFQALKRGNFYSCLELLGDPKGFNAWIESGARVTLIGESVRLTADTRLKVQLPAEPGSFFEIVVYKDGARFANVNSVSMDLKITERGLYRVHVRVSPFFPIPDAKKWMTWIMTNPFNVTR